MRSTVLTLGATAGFISTLISPVAVFAVTLDRLEASVNNAIILRTDVKEFRKTVPLRAQLDPLFAGSAIAEKGAKASDAEIVSTLIDDAIIRKAFPVTDAEVDQEINTILGNNHIDMTGLKNALREQGFAFEEYRTEIASDLSKRLLIDRELRQRVVITDDDVRNQCLNSFIKNSPTPLNYAFKMITVTPSNYKSPAAAKDVAMRALREIRGGESFEEVAKRVSDGPSAATGGDLGTLPANQIAAPIREQLNKMKINQVSDVLGNAQSSFFILKLVDIHSKEDDRCDKMKEEIRSQLAASEFRRQYEIWLDRQRQLAFIHRAGESSVAGLPASR